VRDGDCEIPGCINPLRYSTLCNAHYLRRLRYGDARAVFLRPTRQQRFEKRIVRLPGVNSCWAWSGAHFKQTGYASFNVPVTDGGYWQPTVAHRVSYELYKGEIPHGYVIDHLCRNRGCVNPEHLEAVTQQTNILRGTAPSALAVRTNRCQRGHELTEENVIRRPCAPNKRECRECARMRERQRNRPRGRR
jgi:hypothetical protein